MLKYLLVILTGTFALSSNALECRVDCHFNISTVKGPYVSYEKRCYPTAAKINGNGYACGSFGSYFHLEVNACKRTYNDQYEVTWQCRSSLESFSSHEVVVKNMTEAKERQANYCTQVQKERQTRVWPGKIQCI